MEIEHKSKGGGRRPNSLLIGLGVGALAALAFGVPTALVPTPYFIRMVPATPLDYVFLLLTAGLLGTFVALHLRGRAQAGDKGKGEGTAFGGVLGGIVAFGCPICNKLLIALLGVSAVLTYIDPYRPLIGALSVAALGAAVYLKVKTLRASAACPMTPSRRPQNQRM
jgi:hypothetical protein